TENGTLPEGIAQAARDSGLTVEVMENMTLQDLHQNINQGVPTIVLCQAWRDNTTGNWTNNTGDSHYLVVIGMDDQNIYFEDPAILGSRGYISLQEFLERWHDQYLNPETGNNTTLAHLGIVVTDEPVSRSPFIEIG
ncbi:MAG TPA: C39 family peptidase, partial [Methanobacterium sp.]